MLSNPLWDTELIQRYDQVDSHYTGYPGIEHFHAGIGATDLKQALHASRAAKRPLSLYVHLPFCANSCYFCACTKVITKDRGRALPYIERLEREIELISAQLDPGQLVEQLYFGGGTPTFLSHAELRRLMTYLRRHFKFMDHDSGDYSIEIDPREADWATMGLLRELGFNRVSLGVQDLDPEVQLAVNRLQSLEETRAIVDAARTLKFRSVNIDLIYGLPKQTPDSFARTLVSIIDLQPERLSLYNYTHQPERIKAQQRIDPQQLPTAADKHVMLHRSIEQLSAAGYRYLGMGLFALADDELACAQEDAQLQRNIQGYTRHAHCDQIGLGVCAISQIGDLYSQNDADLQQYQRSLDNCQLATRRGLLCTVDDRLRRTVIEYLICQFSLNFSIIEAMFNIDFRAYFADLCPALQRMAAEGLLDLTSQGIEIRPTGRLLVHAVCQLFEHHQPADGLCVQVG